MDAVTNEQLLASLLVRDSSEKAALLGGLSSAQLQNLMSAATRHNLKGQLYDSLAESGCLPMIPPDAVADLKQAYRMQAVRGLRLSAGLGEILAAFNRRKLPVIVLKGPHLAERVYNDWALRPMGDIDLMVRRDDLEQAIAVMQKLGYATAGKVILEAYLHEQPHMPKFMKENCMPVELHWALEKPGSPFRTDMEGVWRRAESLTIAGAEAMVLSGEDLLLYLCIHAAYRHRFRLGLLPLLDVHRCLKALRPDVLLLQSRAAEWKALRCLWLVLLACRELFGESPDPLALDSIVPPDRDERHLEWALSLIREPGVNGLALSENLVRLRRQLSLRDRVMRLVQSVFLSPRSLAAIYPVDPESKRIYLYYPVRLMALLGQYGRTVLSLLLRNAEALAEVRREEQSYLLADWLASGDQAQYE